MRRLTPRSTLAFAAAFALLSFTLVFRAAPIQAQHPPAVRNVLVDTMDGMRWQAVFGG
jgi:hypothetical protein